MNQLLTAAAATISHSWDLLLDSAIYVLFGIIAGGILKAFLSPEYVARHLGKGKILPVIKAALFGIPLPLCSCGVLPAAFSLKKQGANNGATTAFLISTPESGVDSITISYALLDPIMTIARPLTAFVTAFVAGVAENFINPPEKTSTPVIFPLAGSCGCDNNCADATCPAEPSLHGKIFNGIRYALTELWEDLAVWFLAGILLGGTIAALVPEDLIYHYLGGGITSMLIMLIVGIPLYICASASTPIAAALILKGVSPGTALVFLLVGPATNMATLTALAGFLGRRTIAVYLLSIATVSLLAGLGLDAVYAGLGITASASIGQAREFFPPPVKTGCAILLLLLSVRPLIRACRKSGAGKS